MSGFVVSARKYRPATFDTVVGQSSITETLKNAIRNKHLAQAFLFCGPRGVGKTTTARILAKTVNCSNITADVEPCNQCESCVSFNTSHSLNIFELDAASNNKVEDIHNLLEQVRYAPHSGKYKIYIIDEVHMLTQSAFNAFLKTLEEPPSYAIFILATTEKHKILPTIISRCQIFDFNRISVNDIIARLETIAEKENITTEHEALHIIAQKADGALRDALTIFDQIVSFSGSSVTYKDVITNLNVLDIEYYFRMTDSLLEKNISESLLIFDELLQDGFDGHQFINGLSSHFRNLLVCKDAASVQLLEVSQPVKDRYFVQSKKMEVSLLLDYLSITNKCDVEYKMVRSQRLHVELALMKMCSMRGEVKMKAQEPKAEPVKIKPAEVPASVVAEPKKTVSSPSVSSPIPSIKDALNKPKDKKAEAAAAPAPDKKKVDDDELKKVWEVYAGQSARSGDQGFYSLISKSKPVADDCDVIIQIENAVEENKIKAVSSDLQVYLRTKLNNPGLILRTVIKETPASERAPYTRKEKFEHMAQKNPSLITLHNQFDLDFD